MSKTANLPKVTIITVTYNAEATLERTLKSVAGLEYGPLEYLIIDGGNSDGTLALIQDYEKVVDHWISEPDEGLYDAMNKGMALAKGRSEEDTSELQSRPHLVCRLLLEKN